MQLVTLLLALFFAALATATPHHPPPTDWRRSALPEPAQASLSRRDDDCHEDPGYIRVTACDELFFAVKNQYYIECDSEPDPQLCAITAIFRDSTPACKENILDSMGYLPEPPNPTGTKKKKPSKTGA